MTEPDNRRSPDFVVQVMVDLMRFWDLAGAKGVVIGGVAASVLGAPRYTKDIDATIIVNEENLDAVVQAARDAGFEPRDSDPVAFARRWRMVLLRHRTERLDVDVSLAGTQFEIEAVVNAELHELAGVRVPLPRVVDLLTMKAFAGRPQDYADIAAVLDAHPDAEIEHVRQALAALCDLREDDATLLRFNEFVANRSD